MRNSIFLPRPLAQISAGISGKILPAVFFDTLLIHKAASARANASIGLIPDDAAEMIAAAAAALRDTWDEKDGPPSLWQSGCGLEFNRWANQSIAQKANGHGAPGLDASQVNLSQSTNDTIPSVLQVSLLRSHRSLFLQASAQLERRLGESSNAFAGISMMGRTFLRDARPMPAADMFGAWIALLRDHREWLSEAANRLGVLPQGGYSLGNGDGVDPRFAGAYVSALNTLLDPIAFSLHSSPSSEISGIRALAGFAGALAAMASGLEKVACDIQLLCSGPAHGFQEMAFTGTANDSTTLAGKSNPRKSPPF